MMAQEQQLESVSLELQELTLRRHHLNHRLQLLDMLKEFRKNADFCKNDDTTEHDEYKKIMEELGRLSERKKQLQAEQESLDSSFTVPVYGPDSTSLGSEVFFVARPPSYSAPQVILDLDKLPAHPSPTQCPHCQQFITTEISRVNGNTTYLVCLVSIFFCCVAGCCLFPFCMSTLKDVVHKCPKCRSHIHTCTKL